MATEIEVFQGNQIGGCVTVITCTYRGKTSRIMIDYGSDLPGSGTEEEFVYPWAEKPVDAVLFTHYHGDHVGRILQIPENVPIYMGSVARQVMVNIQSALSRLENEEAAQHQRELALLENKKRVHTFRQTSNYYQAITAIQNFRIEPYCVDHSAYDAYMFLIEADDETAPTGKKVILHTGDFREHGYRGQVLPSLIRAYIRKVGKRDVDILITEGTMMSRQSETVMTEQEMQMTAADYLHEHKYAFLICSSTNLDSLASFYQAAQSASYPYGRYLYVYSNYVKTQLDTFSKFAGKFTSLYQFKNVHTLDLNKQLTHKRWKAPKTQEELMRERGFLAVIKPEDYCEEYIDAFLDCKPVIIYSMWDGYLNPKQSGRNDKWIGFLKRQEAKGVEVKHLHTSGHASVEALEELINAVDPKEEIYPIHTENPDGFRNLNIREELKERIFTLL